MNSTGSGGDGRPPLSTRIAWRSNHPEIVLLLGILGAPFLPLPWSGLALFAAAFLWFRLRPPGREMVVVAIATAVALTALGLRWAAELEAKASAEVWVEEASRQYRDLWRGLDQEAAAVAELLAHPPETPGARLDAFRLLAGFDPQEDRGRRSLLLLDPDGAATAWAGEGLLQEPEPDQVPRAGLHYRASFGAVTLLAVQPLPSERNSRRPWRVVAGASFPADELPFPSATGALRWSLVDRPEEAVRDALQIRLEGAPTMVVARSPGLAPPGRGWALRVAWGAISFALLALAVMRGVGLVLPLGTAAPGPREQRLWVAALALGGAFAGGMAAALSLTTLAALLVGLGLAAWGLARPRRGLKKPERAQTILIAAGGAITVLLLFAATRWGLLSEGARDLAAGVLVDAESTGLRLALAGAALGLFCLVGRRSAEAPARHDRWGWLSVACLLAGAALADHPAVALPLLAVGGAAATVFVDRHRLAEGMVLAALVVISVLAAAGVWEAAYRLSLRESARTLLDGLSPPTPLEGRALDREIRAHFQPLDLEKLVPRSPSGLEQQDLAYALWQGSPLARPLALSALVVQPREGRVSSFSFGMPLTEDGRIDRSPARWEEIPAPSGIQGLVAGETELRFAGAPWGVVRYWLLPLPGFRPDDRKRLGEVEAGLLKGEPAAALFDEEAGEPALFAFYAPDGRASHSPWEDTPSLPARLRIRGSSPLATTVSAPVPARAYVRAATSSASGASGWQVVYLPFQTPLTSLERAANFGVGLLLLLALAAPPALLLALPRASFRDILWRAVRSYSKRLVIVYTILLLVPLLLLNFVLVRSMEERLRREQQEAGEAALSSAQQVLGERLLRLQPGFGIDTALGDQLLSYLSEVVHHEVNLYWGSNYYSSSRHELFTAGLLPRRIPGEIYSRLALRGYSLSSRLNRVGGTTYLELYAPLRVPGVPTGEERLFLSIPLLAQQEQAARQLADLRRHGLLVTAALFALLVAVGTRLARNFTRPIMQLVEGTRRIAAGAPSLDLAPSELELAALVEAVDEMARKIAEGRERLMREKQVVERMVENITSGVVSLDRERRVLMHNRVAAELLGVEVGESLEEAVGRTERLAPVAAFLRTLHAEPCGGAGDAGDPGDPGEMKRQTMRLSSGSGDGGEREWSLVWVPVPGAGEPAALLVVEDATEVLRGQRLLAWAEMARMIAHEIKNPLTPIRLSAEHMREVYRNDPDHFGRVFDRCTSNILTQVEELRSIASEFSTYSAIPRIDPQPGDLTAAMTELVEGYRAAPPEGVSVDLEASGPPISTRFDAKLLQRAVRNLLENALRATSTHGGRVVVRIEPLNGHARISVADSGPGVRPDLLPRIFDPYFSTHDTGTGLGLPIARRIAEEHGGDITARNRPEGGLEVVVTLPIG